MKQSTGACFVGRSNRADPRRKNRGPWQWSRCFIFRPAPRTQPLPSKKLAEKFPIIGGPEKKGRFV